MQQKRHKHKSKMPQKSYKNAQNIPQKNTPKKWHQRESKIVPKILPKCAQKWYNKGGKMCTKVGYKK